MSWLAFDTTTSKATVALSHQDKIYALSQEGSTTHSEFMLQMIHTVIEQADSSLSELEGIIFGRGPGSFTGVRMACSMAKGLGYALDCLLYPVSDLALIHSIAKKKIGQSHALLTVLDARMNQWYWLSGRDDSIVSEAVAAPEAITAEDNAIYLVGVGAHALRPLLTQEMQDRLIGVEEIYPNAADMFDFLNDDPVQGMLPVAVEPVYIRNDVAHRGKHG